MPEVVEVELRVADEVIEEEEVVALDDEVDTAALAKGAEEEVDLLLVMVLLLDVGEAEDEVDGEDEVAEKDEVDVLDEDEVAFGILSRLLLLLASHCRARCQIMYLEFGSSALIACVHTTRAASELNNGSLTDMGS